MCREPQHISAPSHKWWRGNNIWVLIYCFRIFNSPWTFVYITVHMLMLSSAVALHSHLGAAKRLWLLATDQLHHCSMKHRAWRRPCSKNKTKISMLTDANKPVLMWGKNTNEGVHLGVVSKRWILIWMMMGQQSTSLSWSESCRFN